MQIKEMELVSHDGFSSHAQEAFGWLSDSENGMGELATALHPPHELMFLYDVAFGRWNDNRHTTGHIIQAGVHRGTTLCMLAFAAKQQQSPHLVYGLDPYCEQANADHYSYDHEQNYIFVKDALTKLGLTDTTCVCCFDSVSFCEHLPAEFPVRLAFIDSNHTATQVAREIHVIEPLVDPGGWLVFHDVFHTKLPEFSAVIEEWMCDNADRYYKWLRLRKYPEEGHELYDIPMSTIACRKKWSIE